MSSWYWQCKSLVEKVKKKKKKGSVCTYVEDPMKCYRNTEGFLFGMKELSRS